MARTATLIIIVLFLGSIGSLSAQTPAEMVDICANQAGDDATYLKDFQVKLGVAVFAFFSVTVGLPPVCIHL